MGLGLERIWTEIKRRAAEAESKKTVVVLARAETNIPLPQASGTEYEAKPVVHPVIAAPSVSGGFNMTEAEKAAARKDAIGKVFSN